MIGGRHNEDEPLVSEQDLASRKKARLSLPFASLSHVFFEVTQDQANTSKGVFFKCSF